jgi:hypothetical protein
VPRRKRPSIPDALLDQILDGTDPRAAFNSDGVLDALGACQCSCRAGIVTRWRLSERRQCCELAIWTTMSRSGLSVTAPMGVQLRVCPLQRRGSRSRAALHPIFGAAEVRVSGLFSR